MQIPNDAVVISGDTLTIHVENLAIADEFAFLGTTRVPSTLSFDITYTKSGGPRKIVAKAPQDPLSAFHWSGKMWMATNSGTFSVSHNDDSFSATGSFSSSGLFGEMGTEKNGVFINNGGNNAAEAAQGSAESAQPLEFVQPPDSANLRPILRSRMRGMIK